MDASTNDSEHLKGLDPNGRHPDGRPFMFHERMMIEKLNNPERTTFWIHTESIAEGLLIPMAATLKHMYSEMEPGRERDQYKIQAQKMRHACTQRKALDMLRSLCPLDAYGMMVMVPSPEECAKQTNAVEYLPPVTRDNELADAIAMANYQAGIDAN